MDRVLGLIALLAAVMVACGPATTPTGTVTADISKDANEPAQTAASTDAPDDDTEEAPTPESIGIKTQQGLVAFLSPELKEGQWASYQITVSDGTFADTYERSYAVLTFFYRGDPCIGIERNSTKPGEFGTRTMWCEEKKYLWTWNTRRQEYNDPQVLGHDAHWSDEAIQGVSITTPAFEGLERISVPAGNFYTLHKTSWDGRTRKNAWHSPQVPGFEAGLVKSVVSSEGITTTTELTGFGGI